MRKAAVLSLAGLALALAGCSSTTTPAIPSKAEARAALANLKSHVEQELEGAGAGNLHVTGVTSVSCTLPSTWKSGNMFKCAAFNAAMLGLGELTGTILPDARGKRRWESAWIPAVGTPTTITTSPGTTTPPPAVDDVRLANCNIDASLATLIDVSGTLVNHDTQTDDYDITVTLLQGSTRVGQAEDFEPSITAGQISTWSTTAIITPVNGGAVTCQLASVSRTASNP